MPIPKKYEKEKDYIKRCIPQLRKEGKSQKQATAICYSMFRHKDKKTTRKSFRDFV